MRSEAIIVSFGPDHKNEARSSIENRSRAAQAEVTPQPLTPEILTVTDNH